MKFAGGRWLLVLEEGSGVRRRKMEISVGLSW